MRIIDQIDCVLAKHYGFTDEELDFIINYDIKHRMGRENQKHLLRELIYKNTFLNSLSLKSLLCGNQDLKGLLLQLAH